MERRIAVLVHRGTLGWKVILPLLSFGVWGFPQGANTQQSRGHSNVAIMLTVIVRVAC